MGPNYFIFIGNLKIMTRACMPRHARACMFLTLSLYMIVQFLLICMYFSLPSIHAHVCLSFCLCMNMHVPVCTMSCVCVCVCLHACMCTYVRMYWSHVRILYSGRRAWTPFPGQKSWIRAWVRPPVHPSIENCKVINQGD